MVVGSVAQSVTVQANALQVQSETSEINDLMTGKQISQSATNGRNITELATLGMGVTNNLPDFNGVFSESASTISDTNRNHHLFQFVLSSLSRPVSTPLAA